jgi:4-amino-4-deoxy-L-arabinose transferase-like glycosyltransferase
LNDRSAAISSPTPLVAGLVWGWMPFLWSQAVIIEVHGLQSLFLVLALWWIWILLKGNQRKDKTSAFILLAFCFGLSIGNHITILLFLPAILFALWIARKNGLQKRMIFGQIIAIGLGTLIYLYLPIRATYYPPINWGNPQTCRVSGGSYPGILTRTW